MSRRFESELPAAVGGERLDRVVAMLCDVTRAVAAELVDGGSVRLDGEVVTRRSERVAAGGHLVVDVPDRPVAPPVWPDPSVSFTVVHEDADVVVVDKPAGLVVHPGAGNADGTLAHGLLARYPEVADVGEAHRPGIVHRLDRDTSGLLAVARTHAARTGLTADLAARRVRREYLALVWGAVAEPRGRIEAPIGRSSRDPTRMAVVVDGKPARTSYEVVASYRDPVEVTLLRCRLESGRTHQIRVHLSGIGHPVVGDPTYGGRRQSLPLGRQFLHAAHLAFDHPVSRRPLAFDSDLPDELAAVLDDLA